MTGASGGTCNSLQVNELFNFVIGTIANIIVQELSLFTSVHLIHIFLQYVDSHLSVNIEYCSVVRYKLKFMIICMI